MTNKNYSHLTIVLDRSGSMSNIAQEMESGLKTLLEDQKKLGGKCTLSFIKFDDEYQKELDFVDIHNVKELKLHARGLTALNDALGRAIVETGETLSKMKEEDRPGLITVVVVTDGMENASKEFSSDQIKKMISEQESKYNWHFNFLGANQDSFATAANFGIKEDNVSNYTNNNSGKVFDNYSKKFMASRSALYSGQAISMAYNESDRTDLNS